MPYKYLRILRYIKYHPKKCTTKELVRVFEGTPIIFNKYEGVSLLVLNLIAGGYCRGRRYSGLDEENKNNYIDITITHKGEDALNWINWVPIVKDIIGLTRDLKK